jgi:SAM-dependent methyltransferase
LPLISRCENRQVLEVTRRVCYGGGDIRAGWPGSGVPETNLEEFKPFAQWALQHWAMYYGFYPSLKRVNDLIVDVGCGMGYATYNLGSLFPQSKIVGVDLDRNSILYANKFNTLSNVKFFRGDAFKLETRKADIIFAAEILEHLPAESHIEFTEKCLSLLKTGGTLCMTTPNGLDELDEPFGHIGLLNRARAPAYFEHFKSRIVDFGYYDNQLLSSGNVDSFSISGQFKDFEKADRNRSHFRYILR